MISEGVLDDLGVVMGVWAHPDDEAYLSGGLMAALRDRGARVVCVTATRGERGTADPDAWPPDRLGRARTAELAFCLAVLGVREHHWLDFPDGGCAEADPGPAVDELSALVAEVRPDTVITFGPDGITGHSDHKTVSEWAGAAFAAAAPPGARLLHAATTAAIARRWTAVPGASFPPGYPLARDEAEVDLLVRLDAAGTARKVAALAAQATQTAGLMRRIGPRAYADLVSEEAFVQAGGQR